MHVLNVYICINTPRGRQPTVVYSLEELLFSRFFKNNKLLNLDFINSIPTCLLRRCVWCGACGTFIACLACVFSPDNFTWHGYSTI